MFTDRRGVRSITNFILVFFFLEGLPFSSVSCRMFNDILGVLRYFSRRKHFVSYLFSYTQVLYVHLFFYFSVFENDETVMSYTYST